MTENEKIQKANAFLPYTDLNYYQIEALLFPNEPRHRRTIQFLEKKGLVVFRSGLWHLTPNGRHALQRAQEYLYDKRKPALPLLAVHKENVLLSPVSNLDSSHLQVLLSLALRPGLAWGFLCAQHGEWVVYDLWRQKQDYIIGNPAYGMPQYLTWPGLFVLEDSLRKSSVPYTCYAQNNLYIPLAENDLALREN